MVYIIGSSKNPGYVDNFIGAEWGDEGKGKIVDIMAESGRFKLIVRYNGGANAGHSIVIDDVEYAFNQLPSGVAHEDVDIMIAPGSVVELAGLLGEVEKFEGKGFKIREKNRLKVSEYASAVLPHDVLLDILSAKGQVGTTGRGIGPTYSAKTGRVDKNGRIDVRVGEFVDDDPEPAFAIAERNLRITLERLRSKEFTDEQELIDKLVKQFDVDTQMRNLRIAVEGLRKCMVPDPDYINKRIRDGINVLLEGAQAFGLDNTYGVTPYVTSSNLGSGAALHGAGVSRKYLRKVYAAGKFITTKVGKGPYPGVWGDKAEEYTMEGGGDVHNRDYEKQMYGDKIEEMMGSDDENDVGKALRVKFKQYGVVSGRPRMTGKPNAPHLRNTTSINGVDGYYIAMLDALSIMALTRSRTIQTVTGYKLKGQPIDYVPGTEQKMRALEMVIRETEAWNDDLTNARRPGDLPEHVRRFIREYEEEIGAPIFGVGVSPSRDGIVHLHSPR